MDLKVKKKIKGKEIEKEDREEEVLSFSLLYIPLVMRLYEYLHIRPCLFLKLHISPSTNLKTYFLHSHSSWWIISTIAGSEKTLVNYFFVVGFVRKSVKWSADINTHVKPIKQSLHAQYLFQGLPPLWNRWTTILLLPLSNCTTCRRHQTNQQNINLLNSE